MTICKTCVLTDAIPSVRIGDDGICNYCQNFKGKEYLDQQRAKLHQKFNSLIEAHKAKKAAINSEFLTGNPVTGNSELVTQESSIRNSKFVTRNSHEVSCNSQLGNNSSLVTCNSSVSPDNSSFVIRHSKFGTYDILLAYSGGKDSTYTLDLLKNYYGLHVLALTFDHGFVSPYALDNIRRVVETLGVDHMMFKPDFQLMRKIFLVSIDNEFHPPKALERASSICNSCMGLVKFITLRTAIEKRIPFVAYGWSPGQAPIQSAILKNHPSFIAKAQHLFLQPLGQAVGPAICAYFLDKGLLDGNSGGQFPYNINLLAFHQYNEDQVFRRITELGWKPPQDTDPNSTNCLLNALANQVHCEKHGYHPYAMEMAELVREGIVAREKALHRLTKAPNPEIVTKVKNKLGI